MEFDDLPDGWSVDVLSCNAFRSGIESLCLHSRRLSQPCCEPVVNVVVVVFIHEIRNNSQITPQCKAH